MSASSQAITLPLSMPKNQYIPVTTQLNSKSWEQNIKVTSRTVSSFTINTYSTLNDYVAWHILGFQQWGFVAGTTRPLTATLPLTVNSFYTVVCGCKRDAHVGDGNAWYQVSNSQIRLWGHEGSQEGKSYIMLGKVQQWGYNNTSSAATIYFPIAFPSACYSVVLGGYRQCTGNQRATSITKTSFYLGGDSESDAQYSRWMAVGSQQWGTRSGKGATGEHKGSVTFPISFTTCLNVETTQINPYDSSGNDIWMQVESISASSFVYWAQASTSGCYDGGCYWIAIGKGQQWGYNSNNAAGATTGFPISFTSACYGVVHCSGNTGRVEGNPYISSLTKSQINWGQYGLGYWIAFGL